MRLQDGATISIALCLVNWNVGNGVLHHQQVKFELNITSY
jgi:hypothetical protein